MNLSRCFLVAAVLGALSLRLHAETRVFVGANGSTLRGELVSVNGEDVTIKREDGQTFTLKASTFCPSDLEYFREHKLKAPGPNAQSPAAPTGKPDSAAGPEVTAASKPPPNASSQNDPAVLAVLLGTWRWTNKANGWTGTRTFKPDGVMLAEEKKKPGKWYLENDRVVLEYDGGGKDYMPLPLDPNNSKALISRRRTILAVKEPDAITR